MALEAAAVRGGDDAPFQGLGLERSFRRHETGGYLDPEVAASSAEKPIDAANRGFKLLVKMGWREGTGLGKAGNEGIVAPLHTVVAANDSLLGLGKGQQYTAVLEETAVETAEKRRRLAEGDATVALLRASAEAKAEAVAAERRLELAAFFCDWCGKQYTGVAEWEVRGVRHAFARARQRDAQRRARESGIGAKQPLMSTAPFAMPVDIIER